MARIATLLLLFTAFACQIKGKQDSGALISGNQQVTNKFTVTVPASKTYTTGETLTFSLAFPYAVDVTGTPRLVMNIGGSTQYATYASGNGTKTLLFSFTIVPGLNDSDGITLTTTIDLNGGTLKFTGTNGIDDCSINLTIPSTSSVKVDTTAPSALALTPPTGATYMLGMRTKFYGRFDENVVVTGTPRLTLTVGASTRYANYAAGSGSTTLSFSYLVTSSDFDANGIAMLGAIDLINGTIVDSVGNTAAVTFFVPSLTTVLVDGDTPYVKSIVVPTGKTYVTGDPIDFVFTYSEAVTVMGTPSLGLTVGSTSRNASYQSGSGTTQLMFRHIIQSGDFDSDGIAAATSLGLAGASIKDAGGTDALNSFVMPSLASVFVNNSNPYSTGFTVATGTYYIGQALTIVANFDQAVTVTGTPQVPVALDVGGTVIASYVSGSGTKDLTFTLTVPSGSDDPTGITVTSPLSLNGGTISALGQNAILSFSSPSTPLVIVSGTRPTITSITPPSNGTFLTGQNVDFLVNFSETVLVGTPANAKLQLTVGSSTVYAT